MQRVRISDAQSSWSVGTSFLATTDPTSLTVTAGTISDGPLGSLKTLLGTGSTVLSAWDFSTDGGYATGDPAYLSFGVGAAQLRDRLQVWQYSSGSWSQFAATDLTYDRIYASLTVARWAFTP